MQQQTGNLKDRVTESNQAEQMGEKNMQNDKRHRELSYFINCSHIHSIENSKAEERKGDRKFI